MTVQAYIKTYTNDGHFGTFSQRFHHLWYQHGSFARISTTIAPKQLKAFKISQQNIAYLI